MVYLFLCLAVVVFALVLKYTKTVSYVYAAAADGRKAVAVIRNNTLDDTQKELATRHAAIAMFVAFWHISWRMLLALAATIALLWLGSTVSLYTVEQLATASVNTWFLLASTVAIVLAWRWLK